MHINVSGLNSINPYFNYHHSPKFTGVGVTPPDSFEKSGDDIKMKIYNPFTERALSGDYKIDLNSPQKIVVEDEYDSQHPLILDYDPSRTGVLRNKTTKMPFEVNILKSTCPCYDHQVGYHFMSKDLKKEYGYVQLCRPMIDNSNYKCDLFLDYPEYDIVGPRIVVQYLKNMDEDNVSGVGILADKMAVKHCLEEGIEPNIVSYAGENSHVAHFKRGKRFIPPNKGSIDYIFLNSKYGKTDPNEILMEQIQDAKWHGTDVDLSYWGYLMMYLPKDLIEEYR